MFFSVAFKYLLEQYQIYAELIYSYFFYFFVHGLQNVYLQNISSTSTVQSLENYSAYVNNGNIFI